MKWKLQLRNAFKYKFLSFTISQDYKAQEKKNKLGKILWQAELKTQKKKEERSIFSRVKGILAILSVQHDQSPIFISLECKKA